MDCFCTSNYCEKCYSNYICIIHVYASYLVLLLPYEAKSSLQVAAYLYVKLLYMYPLSPDSNQVSVGPSHCMNIRPVSTKKFLLYNIHLAQHSKIAVEDTSISVKPSQGSFSVQAQLHHEIIYSTLESNVVNL